MTAQAFCSWDIESEVTYDEEGTEVYGDDYALINKVYVPESERGNGLGRKLMLDAIEEIKAAHPGVSIRLWCEAQDDETDTEKLAGFYESLGFSSTGNGAEMEL